MRWSRDGRQPLSKRLRSRSRAIISTSSSKSSGLLRRISTESLSASVMNLESEAVLPRRMYPDDRCIGGDSALLHKIGTELVGTFGHRAIPVLVTADGIFGLRRRPRVACQFGE